SLPEASGCLRCAAGGRALEVGIPECPGPGRVALAAGGWIRVVGPQTLPAGGVVLVSRGRVGMCGGFVRCRWVGHNGSARGDRPLSGVAGIGLASAPLLCLLSGLAHRHDPHYRSPSAPLRVWSATLGGAPSVSLDYSATASRHPPRLLAVWRCRLAD